MKGDAHKRKWVVAIASAILNAIQAGAFFMTPTVLMPGIITDLGIDLSQATIPIAVGKVAYVLALFPGGVFIDHFGPRQAVLVGLSGIALFMTCYAFLVRSFQFMIISHISLAIFVSISGVPVYSIFIAQWLSNDIGLAMGLVLAGYSAAGTLAPAVIGPIASAYGWRTAMGCIATLIWTVGIPIAYRLLLENKEENKEMKDVSGEKIDENSEAEVLLPVNNPSNTFSNRNRFTFIGFASSYFFLQYCVGCFSENILFYLHNDLRLNISTSSLYLSALNLSSFVAKIAGGYFGDRFNRFLVAQIMAGISMCSILILFLESEYTEDGFQFQLTGNPQTVAVFSCLFGFGYGGVFNSLYSLVPGVFGLKDLGVTQSILFGVGLIGNAIGTLLTGNLRVRFGSYIVSFLVATFSATLTFVSLSVTKKLTDNGRNSLHQCINSIV